MKIIALTQTKSYENFKSSVIFRRNNMRRFALAQNKILSTSTSEKRLHIQEFISTLTIKNATSAVIFAKRSGATTPFNTFRRNPIFLVSFKLLKRLRILFL